MPALAPTLKMAEIILGRMSSFCDKVEIAGSIRRRREWVNDIDIVALPRPGEEQAFRERCKHNSHLVTDGPQTLIVRMTNGLQLDLWIAQSERKSLFETEPTNYGSLFLMRTGSKEHNIYMIERAKTLGLEWNPYRGVLRDGKVIASATEAEIFEALKLDFIPPERRER